MGCGADEPDASRFHGLGEGGVLAQEAVAWVDGVCARVQSGLNDAFDDQVALVGRGGPNTDRFIGRVNERGMRVCFTVNRHSRQPHLACRAHHTQGNFSSVGHQNFGDGTDLLAHGSSVSQRM